MHSSREPFVEKEASSHGVGIAFFLEGGLYLDVLFCSHNCFFYEPHVGFPFLLLSFSHMFTFTSQQLEFQEFFTQLVQFK
jgi:hypothetical protein